MSHLSPGAPQVALNDGGGRVVLKGDRVAGLPALPPDLESSVAGAVKSRRLETPEVLKEIGCDDAEIERLAANGVVELRA